MASYREKIKQRCCKTESGSIAWHVESIEHGGKLNRDFYSNKKSNLFEETWLEEYPTYNEYDPTQTIQVEEHFYYKLEISDDCMVYYIYRSNGNGDTWFKIIPTHCDKSIYNKVLEAQPWKYL